MNSTLRETTPTSKSSTRATEPDRGDAGIVTSIVTTTLNEGENVGPLLAEIFEVMGSNDMREYRPFEVIVVDDGSTDGTRDVVEDWIENTTEVKAVYNRRAFGQSPALKAGIDRSNGEIVITMDADLQNDPHDIPALLDRLEGGYDCVNGWRKDRHDPWHKTIPSAIQTPLAKLTGPDINDFGCTLAAYNGDAIRDIDLYGEGHRYIPSRLHKLGYRVTEQVVNHRAREYGESRYGVGRLIRGFLDLAFHVYWYRYSSRPGHLFGAVGLILMTIGGAVGGHAVAMRLVFGSPLLEHLPRLVIVGGMVLFGLQLVLFGLVAEFITKLYYREEDEYRVERTLGF